MSDQNGHRLTTPRLYLVRMLVFLALAAFGALILNRQIVSAFLANPGLNGLIFGVLLVGIVFALRQVWRLFREVRFANDLDETGAPRPGSRRSELLAPMAAFFGARADRGPLSATSLRAVMDSIATRLDESRETLRYMTGLLIFLGLLGTFYGVIETVGSLSNVISSLRTGGDAATLFDELKAGLTAPLEGLGLAFSPSLFGIAGSLVLNFLDLQAGQAQARFYNELEERLAASGVSDEAALARPAADAGMAPDLKPTLDRLQTTLADLSTSRSATQAITNLAEGIQGLVQHMRSEQQMIRDWVESQADQQREVRRTLDRLTNHLERAVPSDDIARVPPQRAPRA